MKKIKKKDYFALLFIFVSVVLILILILKPSSPPSDIDFDYKNGTVLFYYGETCPHCRIVENYIAQNSLDSKITIISKEVYKNKDNQNELFHVGDLCKINRNMLGVPLIFYNGECFIGDVNGIELLKSLV